MNQTLPTSGTSVCTQILAKVLLQVQPQLKIQELNSRVLAVV